MTDKINKLIFNFITNIIDEDLKKEKKGIKIVTRFPPEPNGHLHIGHAKSVSLNFEIAKKYGGSCNLRFDDTNPEKEQFEYVKSIKEDLKWLGYNFEDNIHFTSDYFDILYKYAIDLIKKDKAYVDDLDSEQIHIYRGTLIEPGKNSPYRNRSIDDNLKLFFKMRMGKYENGEKVLRAKIDMSHSNMLMRDPLLYRIKKVKHHRTCDKWSIYPMYDFAHCISDYIEGITYSLCTLEFVNNKELYDWILNGIGVSLPPIQIEFAPLNLNYTILSKRKLKKLVEKKYVSGWDDPRMPTISGLKRRGYTSTSIRNFCERIGIGRNDGLVDIAFLEHCVREDLNLRAPRFMAVLNPLKVVITNYPDNKVEELDAVNNPEDESFGFRKIPFSKEIFIEKEDFMENPPNKFFRLAPGREIRLRYAYFITCKNFIKDEKNGEIIEIHCTYDKNTRGGNAPDGRKVKSTLHWVSVKHAIDVNVCLYDRMFIQKEITNNFDSNYLDKNINPNSLKVMKHCKLEPSLIDVKPEFFCQFERLGYFCVDSKQFNKNHLVFNRIVSLRDIWKKISNKKIK